MNRITITHMQHKGPGAMNAYLCKLIDADLHVGASIPVFAKNQAQASEVAWACFDHAIDKRGRVDLAKLGAA